MPLIQYHCARCANPEGHRSRPRTFTERYLLRLILLTPMRCGHCFHRSYGWIFVSLKTPKQVTPSSSAAA